MIRFAILGYGYRAKFYIRVAKALPKDFLIVGIYVRNDEVKHQIINEEKLFATTVKEDILSLNPDFVVNATAKKTIHNVSLEWLELGVKVLQETPLALTLDELNQIWKHPLAKHNYQIAEQYHLYPTIESMIKICNSNIIGEVNDITMSAMHDYHAYSLFRYFFKENLTQFTLTGKKFTQEVTQTKARYEQFTDGKVVNTNTTHIIFEWDDKRAVYDFTPEQYRSPIRNTYINIRGTRGEIINQMVYFLDDNHQGVSMPIEIKKEGNEVIEITWNHEVLYRQTACGLNEDETAVSRILYRMKAFTLGKGEVYPMSYAIEDSYVSILMNRLEAEDFKTIKSEKRAWIK